MARLVLSLHGADKVSLQLMGYARFKDAFASHMVRRQRSYQRVAEDVVLQTVYAHPAVGDVYPRSGNTLAAVSAVPVREQDGAGMDIMLDPLKATRAFQYLYFGGIPPKGLRSYSSLSPEGHGGFEFYPSYVRRGIFFKQNKAPRDFIAGWIKSLSGLFRQDLINTFRTLKARARIWGL